ncbi:MAG: hypothetical protein GXX96_38060 [Planctomycetaceae bacterium]|nr:hypothetical protein [Planctomycetaceae bacterium]
METQLSLFDGPTATADPPRKFANASTTRRAAGVAIRPDAARLRARVLEFIQRQGTAGATDLEIQAGLQMSGDTQRPRRRELQQAGFIVDSGDVRSTASGRAAVVWVATGTAAAVDQARAGEPEQEPPF